MTSAAGAPEAWPERDERAPTLANLRQIWVVVPPEAAQVPLPRRVRHHHWEADYMLVREGYVRNQMTFMPAAGGNFFK